MTTSPTPGIPVSTGKGTWLRARWHASGVDGDGRPRPGVSRPTHTRGGNPGAISDRNAVYERHVGDEPAPWPP